MMIFMTDGLCLGNLERTSVKKIDDKCGGEDIVIIFGGDLDCRDFLVKLDPEMAEKLLRLVLKACVYVRLEKGDSKKSIKENMKNTLHHLEKVLSHL